MKKRLAMLMLPMKRAQALRGDERGQVLVLSAIMVLMAMMLTLATLNSGVLVYNRIRSQTAVDAAADTFAAFQARGLNVAQHLNDVHYWANWVLFGLETVNWTVRITCPLLSIRPPPVFFDYSFYMSCCNNLKSVGKGLDNAQNTIAEMILGVQKVINTAFPVLAGLSANNLAEVNGADKILEWVGEIAGQIVGLIGMDLSGFESMLTSMAGIPGIGDIYAFPLKPGQLIDLNIAEKDPDPDWLPWDTLGIIKGLVIASDVACAAAGSIAMSEEPDHDYGWRDDTYYCGGPSYNTWITGKKRRNLWPDLMRLQWLNPNMATPEQQIDVYTFQELYPVFDQRGKAAESPSNFGNPAFFTVASSQVGGSPLMERSSHSNFEEFSKPELISVHLGEPGENDFVTSVMIWH